MRSGIGPRGEIGLATVRSLVVIGLLTAGLACQPTRAEAPADAGAFLAELSSRAMAQLNETGLDEAEKKRRFRALLNEGFDVEAIARFVLGRYWRAAGDAERREFLTVFEDSMVFRFLPVLGDYTGAALAVGQVRPFGQSGHMYSVDSELRRREGPPIKVDWRIHKGASGYRILDILAEGVSVAVTLRAEYNSVLQQNGGKVAALNKALRDKIAGL